MSNKTQLQANNETLASILSNVLGLPSQESLKHGAYVWKKLTAQGGDFVDFVVSDSPTAYPDGGEQGGYWYEIFKEKLTPSLFGFTKVAVDTFSFTSTTTITTGTVLNHSLGEVPRMWLILSTEPTVFHQTKAVKGYIAYLGGNGSNASGGVIYEDSTTSNGNQASSTAIPNSTQIPFTYDSILTNKYFIAGVEYTLITMA